MPTMPTMPIDGQHEAPQLTAGPLAGVRVLDLSANAGRFATKLFAELGADVVRMRGGDPGPAMAKVGGGLLDWWFDGATSKLALDLDDATGRATLRELIRSADILLESEDPKHREELGLGHDELAALNP